MEGALQPLHWLSDVLSLPLFAYRYTVNLVMQGFYCGSRQEFDDLCQQLSRITVGDSKALPLIEVHNRRPAHFPPAQPYVPTFAAASGMAGKYC